MDYEKPQKGNPHKLTVDQHCFPTRSIARFAKNDNLVQVFRMEKAEQFSAKPDANIFCARRAWDQRAEHGFMKEIEDKYQVLADEIISNNFITLDACRQATITDMFALWNIRSHWKEQPVEDQQNQGTGVAVEYTKDQQEELEKNGITATRPNLTVPGRSITGISIQLNLYTVRDQMTDAHWGILKSSNGEFLVPDNSPNSSMMPLTPNLCLFSQSENEEISDAELAQINTRSIKWSKEYYFARDLSKCPR